MRGAIYVATRRACSEMTIESVREWLPDALEELREDVNGTFLEELDGQNLEVEFRKLMTDSAWYVLTDLEKDLKTVAKEKDEAYNEFNTLIRESRKPTQETMAGEDKEEKSHETDHLQPERRLPDP